jgi:hypothetical protein
VGAKKDDFEGGCAQCLLEMYTIQKMNGNPDITVFGIVSNGDNWEFGKLEGNLFTENIHFFNIFNLIIYILHYQLFLNFAIKMR